MIHHAAARAIGPLVVAMIEASFRTLLVTTARGPHTRPPGLAPTRRRTIDVASIAGGTNAKAPGTRPARAHTKDRLHEAAAQRARPRRSTATSGRIPATDSACRSVESVTRAWRGYSRSSRSARTPYLKPHPGRRRHGIRITSASPSPCRYPRSSRSAWNVQWSNLGEQPWVNSRER